MKLFFPALLSLMVISCTDATKMITINTTPHGASVHVNGKKVEGKSPLTAEVEQRKDVSIVVFKPGYEMNSKTLTTKTNQWLAVVWTKHDPKCKYIEEDSITIPLAKIPSIREYKPTPLPAYNPPKTRKNSTPPPLREMPKGF